jgi:hypothetical protein
MAERRHRERIKIDERALILQDGNICDVKLRDVTRSGVGAYVSRHFKPGAEGLLFARLFNMKQAQELPIEVCWCMPDPMADDAFHQYRIGLRLMGGLTI